MQPMLSKLMMCSSPNLQAMWRHELPRFSVWSTRGLPSASRTRKDPNHIESASTAGHMQSGGAVLILPEEQRHPPCFDQGTDDFQ